MAGLFVVSGLNHKRKVALRQAQGERIGFLFAEDGFYESYSI